MAIFIAKEAGTSGGQILQGSSLAANLKDEKRRDRVFSSPSEAGRFYTKNRAKLRGWVIETERGTFIPQYALAKTKNAGISKRYWEIIDRTYGAEGAGEISAADAQENAQMSIWIEAGFEDNEYSPEWYAKIFG
jgi:hypothetical protein